jgi:hypothetical protein
MCGGEFYPLYDETEDICDYCSVQGDKEDEDGDTGHENCDMFREKSCACRNKDHILLNPAAMYEKFFGKYMADAKIKLEAKMQEKETANV